MKAKFFTIFFLLVFSSNSFAVVVKNYFVNGVANTRFQTWESAKTVESKIDVGPVGYLYNSTKSTAVDFIEAGIMALDLDGFYNFNGSVNRDISGLSVLDKYLESEDRNDASDIALYKVSMSYLDALNNGTVGSFLKDLSIEVSSRWSIYGFYLYSRFKNQHGYSYVDYINLKRISDMLMNAEEIVLAYGNFIKTGSLKQIARGNQEYLDLNLMIQTLDQDLREERKVNLITHSQGNLFGVRLLDYMNDPKSVKMLSVATPAYKVYGYGADGEGGYITLHEDLVSLTFFGALPRNATNHPQEFWADIVSSIPIQRQIEIANANKYQFIDPYGNIAGDITGHGFRESYMRSGTNSLSFISRRFKENYDELKYGVRPLFLCCSDLEMGSISNSETEPAPSAPAQEVAGDFFLEEPLVSEQIMRKGSEYKLSVYHKYQGQKQVSEIENPKLNYYLSKDSVLSSDDIKIGNDTSSIGTDDLSDKESVYWQVPLSTETSSYFIIFKSDPENLIPESNEDNNLSIVAVAIY